MFIGRELIFAGELLSVYRRVERTLTVWMSGGVSQVRWPMSKIGSARVTEGGTGPNAVPSSSRHVVITPISVIVADLHTASHTTHKHHHRRLRRYSRSVTVVKLSTLQHYGLQCWSCS